MPCHCNGKICFCSRASALIRSNAEMRHKKLFDCDDSALTLDSDRVGKFLHRRTTFLPGTDCGPRNGNVRLLHLETINLTRRGGRMKSKARMPAQTECATSSGPSVICYSFAQRDGVRRFLKEKCTENFDMNRMASF